MNQTLFEHIKSHRYLLGLVLVAVLGALWAWPLHAAALPATARQELMQAWRFANTVGRYSYETDLVQTTHPTAQLSNVGKHPQSERLTILGEMDRPEDRVTLQMQQRAGTQLQVVDLKVENGIGYGRAGADAPWTELEETNDLFVAGGDPLGFLVAAKRVEVVPDSAAETVEHDAASGADAPKSAITRYGFELDGLIYARHMREEMEAQLRRRGELPPGVNLDLARQYVDMEGRGEIWLNGEGLPVRLTVHLEFPPERGEPEWVEATIVTTFRGWEPTLENQASQLWQSPAQALRAPWGLVGLSEHEAQQVGTTLLLVLLAVGLMTGMILHRRSPRLYATVAISIIATMVLVPLVQTRSVSAFYDRQRERQASTAVDQARADERAEFKALQRNGDFDPSVDPLALAPDAAGANSRSAVASPALGSTQVSTDTTDLSCASDSLPDDAEADNDGLASDVECFQLGTWPWSVDSDGDNISDAAEVLGFNNGRDWYLDPLSTDSNGDSLLDSVECPELVDIDDSGAKSTSIGTVCRDTDGDEVPDIFDFDNDNDGVPDSVDASPNYVGDLTTVEQSQFNLSLDGYDSGSSDSVVVQFELRPPQADHLYQTNNVLDWPDNDTEGQVTRVYTTTLTDAGYDSTKTDNGDMMLVPMLEITIPAPDDNPDQPSGGLPVLETFSGTITNDTELDSWLDTDALDEYSINVSQDGDTGTLYVYIPLSQLEDDIGDTPVAWSGQMLYQPENATWGSDHQVRMIWLIEALIDSCDTSGMSSDEDYDDWCADDSDNWATSMSVIQTYYEDFYLTGLNVREEYDFEVAVIAQNDALSVSYENYLWHLANALQNTFLDGNLLADGTRFDIDELRNRFGSASPYTTGDAELWDIPAGTFTIESGSYTDQATGLDAVMNEHIPNILSATYAAPDTDDVATLLIAREELYKAASLSTDGTVLNGDSNTLTVSLASTTAQTYTTLSWSPYTYDGVDWASKDYYEYLDLLEEKLDDALGDDDTAMETLAGWFGETIDDMDTFRAGVIGLARNYYMALYGGFTMLVADSQDGNYSSDVIDDDAFGLDYNGDGTADEAVLVIVATATEMLQTAFQLKDETEFDEAGEILSALGTIELAIEAGDTTSVSSVTVDGLKVAAALGAYVTYYISALEGVKSFYSGSAYVSYGTLGAYAVSAALAGAYTFTGSKYEWLSVASTSFTIVAKTLTAANYTVRVLSVNSMVADATDIYEYAVALRTMEQLQRTCKIYAFFSLVASVAVATILFVISTQGLQAGSLAYNALVAQFVVSIIVAVIYFVIAAIPGGAAVVAIIGLLDTLFAAICEWTGLDNNETAETWFCGGITGILSTIITYLIYDETPIVDFDDDDRLATGLETPSVARGTDSDQDGFVVGNQLLLTATITNTISMNSPTGIGSEQAEVEGDFFEDSTLHESVFAYFLQEDDDDPGASLQQGTLNWVDNTEIFSTTGSFTFQEPGINAYFSPGLYLVEAFSVPALECWVPILTGDAGCSTRTYADSNPYDWTSEFAFDVYPDSFDGFVELAYVSAEDGYRLSWDDSFPTLVDADGDGLLSAASGGTDPNDGAADTDGDGLNDYWEMDNGFDPESADYDGDGLPDYWEAFYDTNPYMADSDQDGLLDSEEFFHSTNQNPYDTGTPDWTGGWSFVYDYDSSGNALETWVNADPNIYNLDEDEYLDKLERVYGFNPNLASTESILSLASEVDTSAVMPGASVGYTATVTNDLDNRILDGLLQAEFPVDTVQSTVEMDTLMPLDETTLTGSVSTPSVDATQATTLTIRAGAIVKEPEETRILYLPFNEEAGSTTFTDETLNQNNFRCGDSKRCPTANGSYLTFESTTDDTVGITYYDYIKHSSTPFDVDSFSVGFWVYPTSFTSEDALLVANLFDFELSYNQAGEVKIQLDNSITDSKQTTHTFSDATIKKNRWTHVMATWETDETTDTATLGLYINGALVDTKSNQTPLSFDTDDAWFGAFLLGYLDDAVFYTYALTEDEVRALVPVPVLDVDFETLTDNSVEENSVTCSDTSVTTCPTTGGSGAAFDEQKEYVTVSGSGLNFGASEFTVSAWLYPEARSYPFDTDAATAFTFKNVDYDWQGVFGNESATDNDTLNVNYPTLSVSDDGRLWMKFGHNGDTTNVCEYTTAANTVTYDQWQQVTVSYDGAQFHFYINGELIESGGINCSGAYPDTTSGFYIGRPNALGYLYFDYFDVDNHLDDEGEEHAELRINFDGDSSSHNIWSKGGLGTGSWFTTVPDTVSIHTGQLIDDGDTHSFRFFEEDGGNDSYDSGDDSLLHDTDLTAVSDLDHVSSYIGWSNPTDSSDEIKGDLYWTLSNDYFQGSVNSFQVYAYELDADGVADLYNTSFQSLALDFDEAPGQDSFSDSSGNDFEATCDSTDDSCPDSGIPGRTNQAVRFDGGTVDSESSDSVGDYLTLGTPDELGLYDSSFTVLAWIKGDDFSGKRTILGTDTSSSYQGLQLVVFDGKPYMDFYHAGSLENVALDTGVWYHLAYVYDKDTEDQRIYVNGETGDQSTGDSTAFVGTDTVHVGRSLGENYFDGLIDDLRIARYAMSESQIEAVMQEAPELNLHLDEDVYITAFEDDTPYGNDATCSGDACPNAGAKGQMREAPIFDGDDELTISADDALDLDTFSISLWVKPSGTVADTQMLLQKHDGSGSATNFRVWTLSNSLQFKFDLDPAGTCTGSGVRHVFSSGSLVEGDWNHIATTFDGETLTIYLNGSYDNSATFSSTDACTDGSVVSLGENFHGSLDEVAVYGDVLGVDEVQALYDYQVSWVDETDQHLITIDVDTPVVDLGATEMYVPNRSTQLGFSAIDAGTGVSEVTVTVTDGNGSSTSADATQSSTDPSSKMWYYTFVPGSTDSYTLDVEAVDAVGNATTASKTIYVDTLPPSIDLDNAVAGSLNAVTDTVSIHGTIYDDNLDGAVTSGIDGSTVAVRLSDYASSLTTGWRYADYTDTANSNTEQWSVDYPVPALAYGNYSVWVQAADLVGNTSKFGLGTIYIDSYGPVADVTTASSAFTRGSTVITGTVSELLQPTASRVANFHFEEDAGSTSFADGSGNLFAARCTADACPAAGTDGVYGSAVQFDGADDLLSTESSQLLALSQDFTLAAWVKPGWSSGSNGYDPTVLALTADDGTSYRWQLADDLSGLVLDSGSQSRVDTSYALGTDTWEHVTLVHDDGEWRFYRDGLEQGTFTETLTTVDAMWLTIGAAADGSNGFTGGIDEVAIYDSALSEDSIYYLAHPVATTVSSAQIRLRYAGYGDLGEDDGFWADVTLDSPDAFFSTWQYQPSSLLDGPYKIDLKTTDSLGNTRYLPNVWSGSIDLQTPVTSYAVGVGPGQYTVTCIATDYNLTEDGWSCPGETTALTPSYEDEDWFVELFGDTQKLKSLTATNVVTTAGVYTFTACDLAGHCVNQSVNYGTDLAIASSVSDDTIAAGGAISYTLTFTNSGLAATNVVITDTLPADVTIRSVRASDGVEQRTAIGTTPLLFELPLLENGVTGTITLEGTVNAGTSAGTVLTNTVEIGSDAPETAADDNSATSTSIVYGTTSSDAVAVKMSMHSANTRQDMGMTPQQPGDVFINDRVTFTVHITNTGGIPITTLPLTKTYGTQHMRYESAPLPPTGPTDGGMLHWPNLLDGGSAGVVASGANATSTEGSLAPGGSLTVQIAFTAVDHTMTTAAGHTVHTASSLGNATAGITFTINTPTVIRLASSGVQQQGAENVITWATVDERTYVGFNLWRQEPDGTWRQVNAGTIPAQHPGEVAGAAYRYVDTGVDPSHTYRYRLEVLTTEAYHGYIDLGGGGPLFFPLVPKEGVVAWGSTNEAAWETDSEANRPLRTRLVDARNIAEQSVELPEQLFLPLSPR